jgi:hypothetical protein
VVPPLETVAAESDAELEEIIDDHAVGPVVGPPVAPVVDAVPDHALVAIEVAAPVWDVGVELAEVSRHAKTKCMYCGDKIANGSVRFKYYVSKSAVKYLHPTCCNHIPAGRINHSKACLVYQRHFDLGTHGDAITVRAAIDAALLMLP